MRKMITAQFHVSAGRISARLRVPFGNITHRRTTSVSEPWDMERRLEVNSKSFSANMGCGLAGEHLIDSCGPIKSYKIVKEV
jgi:hypothetical protein